MSPLYTRKKKEGVKQNAGISPKMLMVTV